MKINSSREEIPARVEWVFILEMTDSEAMDLAEFLMKIGGDYRGNLPPIARELLEKLGYRKTRSG